MVYRSEASKLSNTWNVFFICQDSTSFENRCRTSLVVSLTHLTYQVLISFLPIRTESGQNLCIDEVKSTGFFALKIRKQGEILTLLTEHLQLVTRLLPGNPMNCRLSLLIAVQVSLRSEAEPPSQCVTRQEPGNEDSLWWRSARRVETFPEVNLACDLQTKILWQLLPVDSVTFKLRQEKNHVSD